MPVVSRDVIWLLSQIRVLLQNSPTCTCDGCTSCSCRRAHACSSGTVFVTVTVDRGRCADRLDRRRGYPRARCRKPTSIAGKHGRSQRRCARTPHPRCTASDKPYTAPVPTGPSGVRPPRQQLRIALRGQIRDSDVLPYRRAQCTQYGWAAMGLHHFSWMISTVHDEPRTIPPGRRCARPTSRFTAAKSAPAGAAGHPGQHRAGGAS